MIAFPNSKINLGLHVTGKRADGYHDIETVFYPVQWCDALELVDAPAATAEKFTMSFSGAQIPGNPAANLVRRAWELIAPTHRLPNISLHLHKNIPMGAGLGGGSSNAAAFIRLTNSKYSLGLTPDEQLQLAAQLGSDCAFFIHNTPMFATGTGSRLSPITVDLSAWYILLVHPGVHSSTADAYAGIVPAKPPHDLRKIMKLPVEQWPDLLHNDFEKVIFRQYPEVGRLKDQLYRAGALYAGMSGSGSAVFGIFPSEPDLSVAERYPYYLQKPLTKIL